MIKTLSTLQTDLEKRINDLVESQHLIAIKAEFEAEGTRIDELAILSELCCKFKVPLTLKIGGPSAQRDFYEAFQLGADKILIPMVESKFSLLKSASIYSNFLNIFEDLKNHPKLAFNVETLLTTKNIDSILDSLIDDNLPFSEIVVGRTDLSRSLGIEDVNSEEIFRFIKSLILKVKNQNININVGGNLTSESFEFIKSLLEFGLSSFESRKCCFRCFEDINNKKFNQIIKLSLEFELAWLNYKKKLYSDRSEEENIRIETIQNRLKIK